MAKPKKPQRESQMDVHARRQILEYYIRVGPRIVRERARKELERLK